MMNPRFSKGYSSAEIKVSKGLTRPVFEKEKKP